MDKFYPDKERGYRCECIECNLKVRHEYYENNKDKSKEYAQKYHTEINPEQRKDYYQTNKEEIKLRSKKRFHKVKHTKEFKEKRLNYGRKRRKENLTVRIEESLRSGLKRALKSQGQIKKGKTFDMIGCDSKFLKEYLESLWTEGMTWENYGFGQDKWVIDHILPFRSFDLSKESEQRKASHYTNLKPLWFEENAAKGDIMPDKSSARSIKFS